MTTFHSKLWPAHACRWIRAIFVGFAVALACALVWRVPSVARAGEPAASHRREPSRRGMKRALPIRRDCAQSYPLPPRVLFLFCFCTNCPNSATLNFKAEHLS